MRTINEILKAIKCCVNPDPNACDACPYLECEISCLKDLHADYTDALYRYSTDIHVPKSHIDQVYDFYLAKGQVYTVAEEECAELIQAITKYKRNGFILKQGKCRKHIVEELTHVEIMLRVLMKDLGIDQKEIDAEVLRKAYEGHFDTSDYGIDPNEVFPNQDIGECKVRTTSSGKSTVIIAPSSKSMFAECPKWPESGEIDQILKNETT